MSFPERIKSIKNKPIFAGLGLLILGILAYGIYLGWMGFYWDDWGWIYFAKAFGSKSLLIIDQKYRPLSGVLFYIGSLLFGQNPLGWQISNFIARWLSAFSLWWTLSKLWPEQKERGIWIAFIFLIYPGYNHQFVSVNSIRHVLPYSIFFLSLGTMILGAKNKVYRFRYTVASIILALISMLTTEYYYGLEFIRPLILFLIFQGKKYPSIKEKFEIYLPYLIMLISVFFWRFQVSKSYNYSISITNSFFDNPIQTIIDLSATILSSFQEILIKAPSKIFDFSTITIYGNRVILYSITIGIIGMVFCLVYFNSQAKDKEYKSWAITSMLLGLFAIIIGGTSFIVTSLEMNNFFPSNRSLLSLSFGASLFFVGFLDWIIRSRQTKIIIMSVFIAMTLSYNFGNALSFRIDWLRQADLFNQLLWRAPGLETNTILYSIEIPIPYTFDNALDGPLNWVYDQDPIKNTLGYFLIYLDVRDLSFIENTHEPQDFNRRSHFVKFNSTSDQSIAFYFNPPECLRILHPVYDQYLYGLNSHLQNILPQTNLDQISLDPEQAGKLPIEIYPLASTNTWCYYYQKADLARQFNDWDALVDYGDQAFLAGFSPVNPIEYIPFIQGYAFTNDFQSAYSLTEKALEMDPEIFPLICPIWADIYNNASPPNDITNALEMLIDC